MQASAQVDWPLYKVRAKNIAAQSENKIHSDDVARSLGFSGALVSGVAVYAYMTRPLVEKFGEEWLRRGSARVEFFKPAYEGGLLSVQAEGPASLDGPAPFTVRVHNEGGVEIARLEGSGGDGPASQEDPASLEGMAEPTFCEAPAGAERALISWEALELHRPMWTHTWRAQGLDNAEWCEGVMDSLPIYRAEAGAPLHPGLVLRAANRVLSNQFILPAWIHVASRLRWGGMMRVGQQVEVRAVPVEKFEKKGHQFAVVNMLMLADGAPCVNLQHKFIFRLRAAA